MTFWIAIGKRHHTGKTLFEKFPNQMHFADFWAIDHPHLQCSPRLKKINSSLTPEHT